MDTIGKYVNNHEGCHRKIYHLIRFDNYENLCKGVAPQMCEDQLMGHVPLGPLGPPGGPLG